MNSRLWLTYFSLNAVAPRGIPWEVGADLSGDEALWVAPSLQEFQLGESSEGRRLLAAASAWAARHDDEELPRVMSLFIAEEQRHAAELGRYLMLNGHRLRWRTTGDSCFRLLRRFSGRLEVSLSVLLTAEIIGYVYYRALRAGTGSALLRAICETFLRDEAAHLVFHTDQLGRMRRDRSRVGMWITRGMSIALMVTTCVVVWLRHRPALRRCGLTLVGFLSQCLARSAWAMRARHHEAPPTGCPPTLYSSTTY